MKSTAAIIRVLIGTGILTWSAHERRSDRYGYVNLLKYGDSLSPHKYIVIKHQNDGQHGKLIAVVRQTRESTHIGDLFHGIFPRTPEVGQEIILGEGTMSYIDDTDEDQKFTKIGLIPDDGRNTQWFDMRALYDCHEQTVDLYFEPTPGKQ